MADCSGLDLLAVEAFTWTPTLETACEVCLRESEAGDRVGFTFLDVDNVDQYPVLTGPGFGSAVHRTGRKSRLARVRAIEEILGPRGVTVIPSAIAPSRPRLSCAELGIGSIESLRGFRWNGAALGIGTVATLIRLSGDSDPDFAASRKLADRVLNSAYRAFVMTQELIERWRPKKVLLYNGRFAVSKAIAEAARLKGVGVLYHELVSTPDRFFLQTYPVHSMRNTRRELVESWSAAGEDRELVGAQYFSPGRGGVILFETQFLEHQKRETILPHEDRWRIVYFVSSIDEYASVEDGFENPLFESQQSAAEWLATWVRPRVATELVIRMHPRARSLSRRERGWWDSLAGGNITVLPAESPVNSYALAASADRVVSHHSSIGAESTYLGAVSILVGDADYRGLDCVYEPATVDQLAEMLEDRSLAAKNKVNCLPFGYQRLMRGEKYRYYEPVSFREGRFFGKRIVPDQEEPPITRKVIAGLRRMDSVFGGGPEGKRMRIVR